MKRIYLLLPTLLSSLCGFAQLAIGTDIVDSSAVFELKSTTKGFLPPRLTQSNMLAIPKPATGLVVYCTDCRSRGLMVYNGNSWQGTAVADTAAVPIVAAPVLDFESTLVGARLFARYNYVPNGVGTENPAAAVYKWYRANSQNGSGAALIVTNNSNSYTIQSADINKWIAVEVSAISVTGRMSAAVRSAYIPAQMVFRGVVYGAVRGMYDAGDADVVGDYIWLDRNLGSTKLAESLTDASAFGSYYQWGRSFDGHQFASSTTSSTLATSIVPNNSSFITSAGVEWTNTRRDGMWTSASGFANNPCPDGFKIPEISYWQNELPALGITGTGNAYSNRLKLTAAGRRQSTTGAMAFQGSQSWYWSASINSVTATNYGVLTMSLTGTTKSTATYISKAFGLSCRCVLK